MWALFVAAHAPGADGEAEQAFHKLSSAADANLLTAMADRAPAPGIDVSGPHLGAVADALARRRRIRFRYRPSQGRAGQRTVDPYGLVFRKGNWYLVGLDTEREDVRSYRLSRLRSAVKEAGPASAPPEGFDAAVHLEAGPWGLGEPSEMATIALTEKVAWLVAASTPGAVARPGRDGWVDVDVPAGQTESFVSWVLSFGPDARVVSPKALREDVVRRLQALAADGTPR